MILPVGRSAAIRRCFPMSLGLYGSGPYGQ